jgi:cobalt-zinc-cadmium efflux system outer membrane protein
MRSVMPSSCEARLRPYPDLRVGAGWRHYNETADNAVRLSISAAIPVFDQNQGNILSAQESLAKTRAEREANRNALIVIAGRAYDSLQGALRELAILRETAILKSRQASDAILEGYGQGRFSFLKSSMRRLPSRKRACVSRKQQNFHIAVATIEGLVGNPFALARRAQDEDFQNHAHYWRANRCRSWRLCFRSVQIAAPATKEAAAGKRKDTALKVSK